MVKQEEEEDSRQRIRRRRRRLLLLLYAHMTSNISLSLFNFNSRTTLLGKLVNNDASLMSKILSRWASTIGLLEFLFNPTIGRLSDKIGRRPFMLCSPIACVLLKTWVYLSPSLTSLSVEKIICDGLRTLSGSTMCAAALSDLLSGEDLAVAFGELYACAGTFFFFPSFFRPRLTLSRRRIDYRCSFFIWSHVFTSSFVCCICNCVCISIVVGVQLFGGDVTSYFDSGSTRVRESVSKCDSFVSYITSSFSSIFGHDNALFS